MTKRGFSLFTQEVVTIKCLAFLIFILGNAFGEDLNFQSAETLLKEGKTEEALFVLTKISTDAKQADPAAEPFIKAEVELKKNHISEAQKFLTEARTLFTQTTKNVIPSFNAADFENLQHIIDLRIDHIEILKRPLFTLSDAKKAVNTKTKVHIELKNGVYRVEMQGQEFRVVSVDGYYKMMRAILPSYVYKTDMYKLRLDFGRAQTDSVIYNEPDELKSPDQFRDDEENYKSIEIHPLSFIGRLFSYKTENFEDNTNTNETSGALTWTTLDLYTGRPAEVLDFIELKSLAEALRHETKLKGVKFWPPKDASDEEVIDVFKTKIVQKETLDFAIYDYDTKNDSIALQILATPAKSMGFSNTSFVLNLTVKPVFTFHKQLIKLNSKRGFLMKNAPNI